MPNGRGILAGYGAAVLGPALTTALALALAPATGGRAGHLLTAPVALAAWAGGWGPGLLATALAGLALDYVFEDPAGSLAVDSPNTLLSLGAFALVTALIAWAARGKARLAAARATSEEARREAEALLEAAADAVVVSAADGRIVRTNRGARERLREGWGVVPADLARLCARLCTRPAWTARPWGRSPTRRRWGGRPAAGVLGYTGADGRRRRFSVRAVPVRGADGRVRGALAVWHDVTDLHEPVTASARTDAAVKTIRCVEHEVGNALTPVVVWSELLRRVPPDQAARLTERIGACAERATRVLDRLRAVVRFAEAEHAGVVMLDLDAAGRPASGTPARPGEAR